MKKYWKLSTVILASSMLLSGGGYYLLTNRNIAQTNNQALLNEFSKDQQSDNVQIASSVNDIEFTSQSFTNSQFAIIKEAGKNDRIYAWGRNAEGQLGLGHGSNIAVPTEIPNFWGSKSVSHIYSIPVSSLIIIDNKEIWSSGSDRFGTFGDGTAGETVNTFKLTYTFATEITSLSVYNTYVAAIAGNVLYTWGGNSSGQLGQGTKTSVFGVTEVVTKLDGTLKKVKCGANATMVWTNDGVSDKLYLCGNSINGYLGVGTDNVLIPTQLVFDFKSAITDFYIGGLSNTPFIFVVLENKELYAWGGDKTGGLGIPSNTIPQKITLPFADGVKQMYVGGDFSVLLTNGGYLYSTGNKDWNGHNTEITEFTMLPDVSNVSKVFGIGDTTFAVSNGKLLAWGTNNYGIYGNGHATSEPKPIEIDPFSPTLPSLKQINTNNNNLVAEMAEQMYNSTTGINLQYLRKWVEIDSFPLNAVLTMASAPVVDEAKKEISLTITSSTTYVAPDGAKLLTPASFPITLTGFKAVPDSALAIKGNKPWLNLFKYNTVETSMGVGASTSTSNLAEIYNLDLFPYKTTFEISNPKVTFDPGTRKGTYTAELSASQYYSGDKITKEKKSYPITLDGFTLEDDSKITQKTSINSEYNLTNINNRLFPSGVLDKNVFDSIFNTTNFPAGTTFTATSGNVVGNEYQFPVTASQAWVDGFTKNTVKIDAKITGLVEKPDSKPTVKVDEPWLKLYQYDTIKSALGEGDTTNQENLKKVLNVDTFPNTAVLKLNNAIVSFNPVTRIGVYNAKLTTNQFYSVGDIKIEAKSYDVILDGFKVEADSTISMKTDIDTKKYNLTNINNKLCPNGVLSESVLREVFTTSNFPAGTTFTATGGNIVNNEYHIAITAKQAWVDGFTKSDFSINAVITGLTERPDSFVQELTPSPDELDSIIVVLKEGEIISRDVIGKLIALSEFPDDTEFTINTVDTVKDESRISFTFTPNKVYKDGDAVDNIGGDVKIFNANVKFEFPVEPTTNNTGLIIGLSVGGGLLLLIIIGLIIWYFKRRNADDYYSDESVLY